MKCIVHTKGHYGIEDPELKFSKKRHAGGLILKELKFKRHKSAVGMGMKNKRIILLPSVTIPWCPSCKLHEDRKNKPPLFGLKRVIQTCNISDVTISQRMDFLK